MTSNMHRLVAIVTIAVFVQAGCYNTYFISKDELEKLESGVEVKEVVTVQGDCKGGESASNSDQATEGGKTAAASTEGTSKKNDSASKSDATSKGADSGKRCTSVPVSTNNAVQVVKENGEKFRVTPFNFMMSERQLVSPEYDKLERLEDIRGAKVREFSTWKTVGTIVGVTAVTVGTFIGIGIASPDASFSE
jgi:2,3-bisphosphoglycerate-independent phosphoglycerate mutase